jgi:tetratricopeptide (TPR) repeat protein
MLAIFTKSFVRCCLAVTIAAASYAQRGVNSNDVPTLLEAGKTALAENRLSDAARAFQRAVDLDPSSVRGHEGLGVALSKLLINGGVRPSNDSDAVSRAEDHLRQAAQLSPSSPRPLIQLSQLEAFLASRTPDAAERADRYKQAQDSLKQVIALSPSNPKVYMELANLQRDEFGPPIQAAHSRMGQQKGPIPDANARAALRNDYGKLVDDAISNAQQATNMNGNDPRPLLFLSKVYRERALLQDTPAEYGTDMRKAGDWQRQFLAVGGHLDSGTNR